MAQQALQTRRKNHFGEAAQSPDLVMEKTSAGEWAPPHSYRHSQRSE
jgi:hypothetical protein